MKVYTSTQIKKWDEYTIQQEGIRSIDLMERAAQKCVEWIKSCSFRNSRLVIVCGKGNNGGDGLAIARLLHNQGDKVMVFILELGTWGTPDFQQNLQRLQQLPLSIHFIENPSAFPELNKEDILIDCLFGTGLSKPLDALTAQLVQHINEKAHAVLAIDLPSGVFVDQSSLGNPAIKAEHTLTFQTYKLALLMPENASRFGNVHILDIGLSQKYLDEETSPYETIDLKTISSIYRPRPEFAHKGNFGHALLMGGAYGKIGAILLAALACLRAGAGLTSVFLPKCGYTIIQSQAPAAMVITDKKENYITEIPPLSYFSSVGIGPGLGKEKETQKAVIEIIKKAQLPLVIDADALNCLSLHPEALHSLPSHSILTPHPKEFERLFGKTENDFERMQKAVEKAKELSVIILLKGHHTLVATPEGKAYFNCTGNAGLAKGGSGDVLTGILTALLAQQYVPVEAALLGVFLHGFAADLAIENMGAEALLPEDVIAHIGNALKKIASLNENKTVNK